MSTFTMTSSMTKKFIKLRLENDHLFQRKFRAWKTFKDILIKEGFPDNINYGKKWNTLCNSYKEATTGKIKNWKYMSTFKKYKIKSSLDRYPNWTTEWIHKLLEIRIENEDIFKTNDNHEENWSIIEKKIKDAGLPLECSVRCIDLIWESHLNKFKIKYSGTTGKNSWPFYNCLKTYFESSIKNSEVYDSDNDMEPLITLKNNKRKSQESNYENLNSHIDNENSEDDFIWTSEYAENLIHLRFQNESVFKKKRNCWDEFHKIMMANGFPKAISALNARTKWGHIMGGYKKALLLEKRDSMYFNLINSYLENLQTDLLKDWSEEWIKYLITLRTKNNLYFMGSVFDDTKKWGLLELELKKAGLPNDHSLRNIHTMWSALIKEFKFWYKKQKVTSSEITWPYYEKMKDYFHNCEPEFFSDKNKCENNEDSICPIEEVNLEHSDIKKEDLSIVKKEYSSYLCRGCLQSSDQMISLYESFDNVALLQKFIECTSIQIENSSNSPNHLCHLCLSQLNSAYEFRKKCEQTELVLKNQLDKKLELKVEETNTHSNSEYAFDGDMLQTYYSSDEEEKIEKPKIKKTKGKDKIIKKKISKKPAVRSKNIVLVPMKSESGEVVYKRKYVYYKFCEICGKSTRAMKQHMATHFEGQNRFKCEICSKTFKYRAGYTTHLKTHNETPLKICQLCGREFYRNLCYRRHMIYHANERKFSCETCGKTFNTSDILRIHIRSHTGERPYPCSICGKAFISRGCVNRHMKVHNKQLLKPEIVIDSNNVPTMLN